MKRGFNFNAGPAVLPETILIKAQKALLNWQNTGLSILEIGHRSSEFRQLLAEATASLRRLLTIPSNYHVLFLGGAARTHFSMIPMNFLSAGQRGGYVITGLWSAMAYAEAQKIQANVYCVASNGSSQNTALPNEWTLQNESQYIYYTPNETVNGLRFPEKPKMENIPVVADMTSYLLTEPFEVSQYDFIFAGAQKNIANAGLTIVIVKDEFLKSIKNDTLPTMFDYRTHVEANSLYATPPTFNCYLAAEMFAWIEAQGGVTALYEANCKKAALLYNYIDDSNFYTCRVQHEARSKVNICFYLKQSALESLFLQQAKAHDLFYLQGHRTAGGLRASIYNAMPFEGVQALLNFMQSFAAQHRQ